MSAKDFDTQDPYDPNDVGEVYTGEQDIDFEGAYHKAFLTYMRRQWLLSGMPKMDIVIVQTCAARHRNSYKKGAVHG